MISAKIIADSISPAGKRITTYELEYQRFIHSELMTHRAFSRNAASSRAIPIRDMLKMVWNNPATPVHWGKYQTGMTAKEELHGWRRLLGQKLWNISGKVACGFAWLMWKTGLAKQVVNRIVEPWSHIKVVVTATEYDNFFYLRNHPDAQPEIQHLAALMLDEYNNSIPQKLNYGDWHLPYFDWDYDGVNSTNPRVFFGWYYEPENKRFYYVKDYGVCLPEDIDEKGNMINKCGWHKDYISLEDAKKVSSSLCAQTSYRKADESVDKAIKVYDRLVTSKPVHASPFEHQARPLENPEEKSGNFVGWFQHRQEIADNVCKKYIQ